MNFFTMLSKVEAAEEARKTAIGKKNFEMPPVGASEAEAAEDEPAPAAPKKRSKKKESLPEGSEADNVLQEDEPETDEEEE